LVSGSDPGTCALWAFSREWNSTCSDHFRSRGQNTVRICENSKGNPKPGWFPQGWLRDLTQTGI